MSFGQIACHRIGVLVVRRFAERVFWLPGCLEDFCSALLLPNRDCNGLLKPTMVVPTFRRADMSVPDYRSTGPASESLRGCVFRCPKRGVNFRSKAMHFRSSSQKN